MAKYLTLKTKISYNRILNKFLFSKFPTSPFNSIWLEISIDFHTKSQGPMNKCSHFTKGRIHPCSAHTACNWGSFTPKIAFCSILFFPNCIMLRFCLELKFIRVYLWTAAIIFHRDSHSIPTHPICYDSLFHDIL